MTGSLGSLAVDLEEVLGAAGVLRHRRRPVVARWVESVSVMHPSDFGAAEPRERVPNRAGEARGVEPVEQPSAHPSGVDDSALPGLEVDPPVLPKRRTWELLEDSA